MTHPAPSDRKLEEGKRVTDAPIARPAWCRLYDTECPEDTGACCECFLWMD